MRLNIVIPTHKRHKLLERTLQSISDAIIPDGFEHVIVVENGTRDGAETICKNISNKIPVIYKYQQQSGKGRALNSVLNDLKNGFVIFLDDDVRVCKELLISYSSAIRKNGKGHIYGGPLLVDYESEPESWLKKYLPPSVTGWPAINNQIPDLENEHFLGANFGAFVEDILAVGYFSEKIGPGSYKDGSEGNPTGLETELQKRMREAGNKLFYIQNAKVWHFVPSHNCTTRWALHRAYRIGITNGYFDNGSKYGVATRLCSIPVNLWLTLPRAALFAFIAIFIQNPEQQFKMKRKFYRLCGLIRGYTLARSGQKIST